MRGGLSHQRRGLRGFSRSILYCCVKASVAVLVMVPDVPVMVMVEFCAAGTAADDPPQAVKQLSPMAPIASNKAHCKLRRFFQPSRQKATASVAPGKNGFEGG